VQLLENGRCLLRVLEGVGEPAHRGLGEATDEIGLVLDEGVGGHEHVAVGDQPEIGEAHGLDVKALLLRRLLEARQVNALLGDEVDLAREQHGQEGRGIDHDLLHFLPIDPVGLEKSRQHEHGGPGRGSSERAPLEVLGPLDA